MDDILISLQAVVEIIEKKRAQIGHNMERAVGGAFIEMLDDVGKDICNLPPAQPEQDWIPVSVRMPEEREWVGTKRFGTTISDEVYVTFETHNGERFTEHISFQNGKVPSFKQREIDVWHGGAVPIAWKPKPEPWKGGAE